MVLGHPGDYPRFGLGKGDTTIAYRYFICLLIFLSYVLVFFHRLCPAVIALDIQSSFGITGTLLGVLSSAYFYSYAIMQLPTGLMADSWGPRKTVSVFLILAGLGSVVMGIAPNLPVAIMGRVLVGIGVSTVFVCNFKLLSEWFTPRQFIIMGSVFMSMGGIGALSSSAPLAWVSNVIGWRMTFLSVGIITLLMAVLVYAFVRNRPSEMGLAANQSGSRGSAKRHWPAERHEDGPHFRSFLAAGHLGVLCHRHILCHRRIVGRAISDAGLRP